MKISFSTPQLSAVHQTTPVTLALHSEHELPPCHWQSLREVLKDACRRHRSTLLAVDADLLLSFCHSMPRNMRATRWTTGQVWSFF
jgi:hypothetical protein